jgi:hypothetical protein
MDPRALRGSESRFARSPSPQHYAVTL